MALKKKHCCCFRNLNFDIQFGRNKKQKLLAFSVSTKKYNSSSLTLGTLIVHQSCFSTDQSQAYECIYCMVRIRLIIIGERTQCACPSAAGDLLSRDISGILPRPDRVTRHHMFPRTFAPRIKSQRNTLSPLLVGVSFL